MNTRLRLASALLIMTTSNLLSQQASFYLGTYTKGKDIDSKGIYTGNLDLESGQISDIRVAAETENPSYLCTTPDRQFLYAVKESSSAAVEAYRIRPDLTLELLNSEETQGKGACHVAFSSKGTPHVYAANYSSGDIISYPVEEGRLLHAAAHFQYEGSGPNPKRQQAPHAHGVYPGPDGTRLYSCDLGTDKIWIHRIGTATQLEPNEPAFAMVPAGSGPRHLAFHPNGAFAYVNNEMAMTVTAFSVDPATGSLTEIQTLSSLPENTSLDGCSSAEIVCHPNGKWLYVSNRGHDSLTVFSIDSDGKLAWKQNLPAEVAFPRGFGMDPTGNWLLVGGQKGHDLATFKISQDDGSLTFSGHKAKAPSPVCVVFLPAP